MYRQIDVHADDQPYQMILWRDDPQSPLKTYKLSTVTYGTASAPFLATRCLVELANLTQSSHPMGSSVIKNDIYVDDVLTGSYSVDQLLKIKQELIQILRSAGMELRKWYSNCPDILDDVPFEDQEKLLRFDEDEYIKTLGIHWQPSSDEFHMLVNVSPSHKITKRVVISDIAKVFDPLGLSAPVITLGKLFMQRLWKMKVGWDEQLDPKFVIEWEHFRNDLVHLKNLRIPRHLFNNCWPTDVDLHGFSDASEVAYGACVYARCSLPNTEYHCILLCAKSRVAPLKKVSLPRLELCAAQLLAQLVDKIAKVINFEVSSLHYWSDSTIVLHWIRTPSSSLKTFVANRVASIQQLTEPNSWKHVDSKNNPADVISRGLSPSQLVNSSIWFYGPPYLRKPSIEWPAQLPSLAEVPEMKKIICTATHVDNVLARITNTFPSSFCRLRRIFAYVSRFIKNCNLRGSDKCKRSFGRLSSSELQFGLLKLCRAVQSCSFADELRMLGEGREVTTNPLKSLSAFLDEDGVIRVGGRIQQSSLPYTTKHPIVLPANNKFTYTVLFYFHIRYLHAGPQALMGSVRQSFWPINARRLASKVFHQCRVCARARPKPAHQQMGNLPMDRITESPPFSKIGIDFCGPVYIHYKGRGKVPTKAYICVFVCFIVKAVHIELVGDMSTDSFLGALKRFVSSRGLCQDIYSDNGTNFVGANSVLHEIYTMLQNTRQKIDQYCDNNQITWHFAPPGAPHFGGMYEAAVKSIKYHLRRVVADSNLTFEEMSTVLKEIECVLNSRPITPMSSSPDDLEVLTPAHFLIGRPMLALPDKFQDRNSNLSLTRRWELVSALKQHFWDRWRSEYVTSLQHRYKWPTNSKNLAPGEMVILKEDNLPPTKWPLARILETHPGRDGKVRVVTIKTKSGIYKRPIHKLCPLPIHDDVN